MRKIIFLLLLPIYSYSQDIIVKTTGDTINCKITMVNDQNIFYTYKKKKTEKQTYISVTEVSYYSKDGKSTKPTAKKPESVQAKSSPPVTKKIKGAGALIVGFVLQGISSILNGVAIASDLSPNDAKMIGYISSGSGTIGTVLIITGVQGIRGN